MPVVGETVRIVWTILDTSRNPLTGMAYPGDVEFRLHLSTSTGSVAASTELAAIVMSEIGTSGTYEISFPGLSAGLYTLQLKELHASTLRQQYRFPVDVFAAGSQPTPTYDDSFCAESDAERWAQLDFTSSSDPSSDEVALFAAGRANEMRGIFAMAGWTISPTTIVDGSVEQVMLREANAIGAAADAWLAKNLEYEPGRTTHAAELLEEYQRRLDKAQQYAMSVLGTSFIGSPMTQGEITLRDEGVTEDTGLRDAITMDQEF